MSGPVDSAISASIEDVPLWYHTLDLPGGVVTPGWFDLRGIVDKLPWPDVRGKRCLDVGTYDGFYAFELERRGASEVIATDIGGHSEWDLPVAERELAANALASFTGEKGLGFEVAKRALGSKVEKRIVNVYNLSPDELGMFDVVVCGSLMLHLRDPVRALEAIRSVCNSWFMSVEEVAFDLTFRFRRRPVADMRFEANPTQWWVVNAAGHSRMIEAAGFSVVDRFGPFAEPFGAGHSARGKNLRSRRRRLLRTMILGGDGVPHNSVLARTRS